MSYDPQTENIEACPNCKKAESEEIVVAHDNSVGCPLCIIECCVCGYSHNSIHDTLHPARVLRFGKGWEESKVCQNCAEEVVDYPEAYEMVKINPVDILNIEIKRLKS